METTTLKKLVDDNKKPPILRLYESDNQNRWVIGTAPAVEKSSRFYSDNIQVYHAKSPDKEQYLVKEKMHSHEYPIQEFYYVLEGFLELDVRNSPVRLGSGEMLLVSPGESHRVKDFSNVVEFLVIRAPISNDKTKNYDE
jgi:mannose-6-phosphate isomerase-like protein (cupin superfamily)